MGFLHLVDFVNFVSWVLNPLWDSTTLSTLCVLNPLLFTLVGSVHFVDSGLRGVHPLYGLVLTLRGVRPLCGLV